MAFGPKPIPLQERFDGKYAVNTNGCWIWRGALGSHGYGVIGLSAKKTITAHRASWLLAKGEIPEGLFVLHNCDVRACVNPNHLRLGDRKENARDLMERGKPFLAGLKLRWRKHG